MRGDENGGLHRSGSDQISESGRLDDNNNTRLEGFGLRHQASDGHRERSVRSVVTPGESGGMADTNGGNASAERQQSGGEQRQFAQDSGSGQLDDIGRHGAVRSVATPGESGGMADAESYGHEWAGRFDESSGRASAPHSSAISQLDDIGRPGPTNGHWRDADWLFCRDGKWRPVESGTFPLAGRTANRVGQLRAYGNAIVASQAQSFIESFMESQQ